MFSFDNSLAIGIRPVLQRKLATSVAVWRTCRTLSVLAMSDVSRNHREKKSETT